MKNYIKERLKEYSSLDGALMIAAGAAIIIFSPLTQLIAYGAIAYGAYKIVKAD